LLSIVIVVEIETIVNTNAVEVVVVAGSVEQSSVVLLWVLFLLKIAIVEIEITTIDIIHRIIVTIDAIVFVNKLQNGIVESVISTGKLAVTKENT